MAAGRARACPVCNAQPGEPCTQPTFDDRVDEQGELLSTIAAVLDGTDWDSGTAMDIAELLIAAGYTIREHGA